MMKVEWIGTCSCLKVITIEIRLQLHRFLFQPNLMTDPHHNDQWNIDPLFCEVVMVLDSLEEIANNPPEEVK